MRNKRVVKWFVLALVLALVVAVTSAGTAAAPPADAPCEELGPESVECGDSITCSSATNPAVKVQNNASGPAIYGQNTANRIGVQGKGKPGVKGISGSGAGVQGKSNKGSGVRGNSNSGSGVLGISNSGYGVEAESTESTGLYATSVDYNGVYGHSDNFRGGLFTSDTSDGLAAQSNGNGYGIMVWSDGDHGTHTNTGVQGGYGLHTEDLIYTGGGCVGCTSMLIAQNGGDGTLELGDVVAVTGIAEGPSEFYARPVILVRRVDAASSQGVVGVVEGRYVRQLVTRPGIGSGTRLEEAEQIVVERAHTTKEPAAPGEYLTVVYRGIAQVKVDDSLGAIQVGDPLSSAGVSGHAMKAQATSEAGSFPSGVIIGKALEPLGEGQGLIWVLVDLQ